MHAVFLMLSIGAVVIMVFLMVVVAAGQGYL